MQASSSSSAPPGTDQPAALDTHINALTYVYASSPKEVETLVTREFHADPNLHKNANVALVGDYDTDGSPSVTFEWTWKWKPPKNTEDRSGGWRNSCSVCFPYRQPRTLVREFEARSILIRDRYSSSNMILVPTVSILLPAFPTG